MTKFQHRFGWTIVLVACAVLAFMMSGCTGGYISKNQLEELDRACSTHKGIKIVYSETADFHIGRGGAQCNDETEFSIGDMRAAK